MDGTVLDTPAWQRLIPRCCKGCHQNSFSARVSPQVLHSTCTLASVAPPVAVPIVIRLYVMHATILLLGTWKHNARTNRIHKTRVRNQRKTHIEARGQKAARKCIDSARKQKARMEHLQRAWKPGAVEQVTEFRRVAACFNLFRAASYAMTRKAHLRPRFRRIPYNTRDLEGGLSIPIVW